MMKKNQYENKKSKNKNKTLKNLICKIDLRVKINNPKVINKQHTFKKKKKTQNFDRNHSY